MRIAVRIASLLIAGTLVFIAGLGAAGLLGIKNPFQSRTIDRSQPALLKSIQKISQYHAAVGHFEVVLDHEHDVKWVPGFIAGERSLFVVAGTVNAYVDFSGFANKTSRSPRTGRRWRSDCRRPNWTSPTSTRTVRTYSRRNAA